MQRHVFRPASCWAVAGVMVSAFTMLPASPGGLSVAINFGADEPDGARSDVLDEAGVLLTASWNNLDLAAGGPVAVMSDNDGATQDDGIMVTWASNNTWSSQGRGEENNTAPVGDDRNLMTGYLDTSDVSVTTVDVTGLDAFEADSFTVYIYVKGGVVGRGGTYTVNGIAQENVDSGVFDGTYIEGMDGNYLLFENVGAPDGTIAITATPTTTALFRAPLNAIEITPGEGPGVIAARRTVTPETLPAECPPNGRGPLTVEVTQALGNAVDPGEVVTVTDTVRRIATDAVTASNGGTVSDAPAAGRTGNGFITSWLILGPFEQLGGAAPGEDIMRLDYLANADVSIEEIDVEPSPGDQVQTDFNGNAASTGLAPTPGAPGLNPGGVPTWFEIADLDDTIDLNEHYGSDIDNIMTYAVSYVTLPEEAEVQLCVGSDDAVQVLIDGFEVWINNIDRGAGVAGECQDLPLPVILDAGEHKVMVKVFEGGGGHALRVGLQDAATLEPLEFSVCTTPGADPCELASTGAEVTWDVTRQQLADGVGYAVDITEGSLTFSGTVDDAAIFGDGAITLGCDTRVTDLVCTGNAAGGLDMSWTNHPFADTAVAIALEVNGVEVSTVSGSTSSTTLDAGDLEDGWNNICVVNSSELPTCCRFLTSGLDLGDLLAGGDGTGTADPAVVGINADLGNLETAYLNADVPNTLEDLQPVDPAVAPFVDSVFIPLTDFATAINSDLVPFDLLTGDANSGTYGHILRDVTHDVDKGITDIWAGGLDTWAAAVSIHGAAGITFDLEALRAAHGELGLFRCFAGVDQCGTANVNLYAILSDEVDVIDSASVLGVLANGGEEIVLPISSDARYLTLIVGAAGDGIGCDHGVFANALITLGDGGGPVFKRGDVDATDSILLTDGVVLLNFLFLGGPEPPCEDAADANDDGRLDITTAVYLFNFLFLGGPPPPAPGTDTCGPDTTQDTLGCASYDNC